MRLTARHVLEWAARQARGDVVLCALLVMAHQAAEAGVPILIGVIIDRAVATGDVSAMLTWTAVLAALFVALSSAGCTGMYLFERVLFRADHALRLRIVE